MREGWKEVKLRDVAEIKYGKDHKKLGEGTYPLYGSGGIMRYVDSYLSEEESILIPRKGTLSNLFYLNQPFSTVDTMFWTKINSSIVVPRFLYYLLKTYDLASFDEGAAIPSLTTKTLNVIKIKVPPLSTQKKIADILSAYDDLIENNLKRIQLLEEQAQLIYEEWFVRMKFPGYETAKINEETGLPEGWEKVKLIEIADITMGQSPQSSHYNQEQKGLPFHQGVKDYGFRFPINVTYSTAGNKIANENDILFSVRAPVGRLNMSYEKVILGRGLAAIKEKKGRNSFLFYQLKNIFFEDNLIGGGAIYNSVTKTDIETQKVLKPSEETINKFDHQTKNNDSMIKNLTTQNRLLQEARDLLLPRLMMGMIDVEEERLGMVAEERAEYKMKK